MVLLLLLLLLLLLRHRFSHACFTYSEPTKNQKVIVLLKFNFLKKRCRVFIRNVFNKKFIFICSAYQSKIRFRQIFANAWSANCFWLILCRTLSVILFIMLVISWTNKMLWFAVLFDEKNHFQFCFVLFYVSCLDFCIVLFF